MAVRRNCEYGPLATAMPGKYVSFGEGGKEPQAKSDISMHVALVCLFCKEILPSHFIFSSLFTGVQMCWRSIFQFSSYV